MLKKPLRLVLRQNHRYIFYPDGQSILSSSRIEHFAVLFWTLDIVLANILNQLTKPAGLASLISSTGTVLYKCTAVEGK